MRWRGFREADRDLLTGHWLPGELLGLPVADRPPLAEPVTVDPPVDDTTELCVAPGIGFARFSGVDWIHRHARLEIGLRDASVDPKPLLEAAVRHGFDVLGLHRVHGLVTPAAHTVDAVLESCGFHREAVVPQALWLAGRPVDRHVWSVLDA
ncbi:GNAT family protein [Streptomyces sp. HUAS MG91]|uniref:GNAT family protein n=1 Tax=Streptomyces tabacisoli TaxID=3156398 RepID=A0AAU8IR50_9ACTN